MLHMDRFGQLPFLIILLAFLSACASTAGTGDPAVNDPIESFNREVFELNDNLDRNILEPAAEVYRDTLPQQIRDGIQNVLRNLRSPILLANQILQGDIQGAGNVVSRFVINTAVGVGGIVDVAEKNGIPYEDEDFGQTLGVWGVESGPYIVLPLLGPSNPRDFIGFVVDSVADPINILADNQHVGAEVAISRTSAAIIDTRSRTIEAVQDLRQNSVDYYAAVRSFYNQSREAAIRDGDIEAEVPDFEEFSDFEDEDFNESRLDDRDEELSGDQVSDNSAVFGPASILQGARPANRVNTWQN